MDPTGDTANGGGVCDVAIDNKDDDDTAMDIKGDYSTLEKETIDNKDESDYAKDIEPGNGVNAHEPEDMMVDDDGEADGARDEQQNEEEDMEGQEEGSQGSDEANNVDQNNDAQSDEDFGLAKFEALDQDETAESFATAKEDSLLTSSDAGYTEDSQEPLDDRLLEETENSEREVHMEAEEAPEVEPQEEPELERVGEPEIQPEEEPEGETQEPELEQVEEPEGEHQEEPELEPEGEPEIQPAEEPEGETQEEPEIEPEGEPQEEPELEQVEDPEGEPEIQPEVEGETQEEPEIEGELLEEPGEEATQEPEKEPQEETELEAGEEQLEEPLEEEQAVEQHEEPILEPEEEQAVEQHEEPILEPEEEQALEPPEEPELEPEKEQVLEPHEDPVELDEGPTEEMENESAREQEGEATLESNVDPEEEIATEQEKEPDEEQEQEPEGDADVELVEEEPAREPEEDQKDDEQRTEERRAVSPNEDQEEAEESGDVDNAVVEPDAEDLVEQNTDSKEAEDASPDIDEQTGDVLEDEDNSVDKSTENDNIGGLGKSPNVPDEGNEIEQNADLQQSNENSIDLSEMVESEADASVSKDTDMKGIDEVEEVKEQDQSSSDLIEKLDDASDSLDSLAKSTDSISKDEALLTANSSDMMEMRALYGGKSEDDNSFDVNRMKASDDSTETVQNVRTLADNKKETDTNMFAESENDVTMEKDVVSVSDNEANTAEGAEQMEVDDDEVKPNEPSGTDKSEVSKDSAEKESGSSEGDKVNFEITGESSDVKSEKDVDSEKHTVEDDTTDKPKSTETVSETIESKDGKEAEPQKNSEDGSVGLEEKKAENGNEAMETDDKTEEDASSKQVKTDEGQDKETKQATEIKEKDEKDNEVKDEKDASTQEIKQETLAKEGEAKLEDNVDQSENTTGVKIIGVTSAVSMDDAKSEPKEERRISTDDQKEKKTLESPVVIDDEEEKKDVKKEAKSSGRTTRSSSAATVKKEHDEKKPLKQEADDKDDDVIAIKEEKKPATKPKSSSKIQKCIVCQKVGKCKYNIVRNGDVKHLCDDVCFKKFRSNPSEYLRPTTPGQAGAGKTENKTSAAAPMVSQSLQKAAQNAAPPPVYKTCSVCQLMNVRTSKPFLSWQGLDFCGEECLGKFQGGLSATCSYCASQINQANRAKFCWRVGTEVKQFCSSPCYTEFVKRLKLCAFCNKDLANMRDSFMAPVGNQGTFKDFCSQVCLAKYEERNSKDIQIVGVEQGQKASSAPKGNFLCAVCGKTGPVKHEIKLEGKQNRLCSDPCLSAFQYANKLTMNTCDNCGTNCYNENTSPQYIQYEGQQKRFCSYMCVNSFKNINKKTVPCAWCGAKKSNFDMIERVDANNKYQLFCSLNCLSLYRVNLQATSNQAVMCDQCRKYVPAQYHLTMSDASVRNFCSYTCVMQFQSQFTNPKQTNNLTKQQVPPQPQQHPPVTTTRSGRAVYNTRAGRPPPPQQPPVTTITPPPQVKQTARQIAAAQKKTGGGQSIPIISNVVSLAPQGNQQQINVKSSTPVVVQGQQDAIKTTTTTTANQTVQQQIIIQPPPPKTVKNKSLLCKPYVQTKATSCKPHTQTKEVQTEGKPEPDRYFIPVPVPVYVPTPLAMYTTPTPVMIPVPIPVPVPVFIPTTKKSSGSILKQIKEIQERIPNDPLEAELLMMAEAVAGKDEESSSESEDEQTEALPVVPPPVAKEPAAPPPSGGGELGEDMLQMALRMASEMTDEPVMDLENSLEPVAVSSVPTPTVTPAVPMVDDEEEDDDTDEYIPPSARNTRGSKGRKRTASTRRGRSKRIKVENPQEILPQNETTPSPQSTAPPPDANFHLKYTYGVNAWKHWVVAKNATIESATRMGSNKRAKMFKTDLLQCTADELNYALCLFVKEVRKPNGEVYAVDSIYYLCLGIQQYLFENGRIDNIFTDIYFEKFTEFLNEVLTMYEPKLNTAGQLVCRIEEEHLWESKQLGAHSPHVLLNSLVYFNTKYFMLKTSEDHLKLSFTHIMKHWKKTASGKGSGTGPNLGRSVYLRYYCPNVQGDPNQKKKKEEMPVYEQTENLDNPLRCPVKLYEFYLSKCPESIKNKNDAFYLVPERSCVPDSPVWYSTASLGIDSMAKMLNRIRLVREIQEAHLHTQPVYI